MIERRRRIVIIILLALSACAGVGYEAQQERGQLPSSGQSASTQPSTAVQPQNPAVEALGKLAVKGRAPRTDYKRAHFGDGWQQVGLCDVRNHVLQRDMREVKTVSDTDCTVLSGVLDDPYTGKQIRFIRGPETSDDIQIDHVVALSDAWQKGAQQMTAVTRVEFSNDPLNLLAVDGPTNQKKGDGDAATWLPSNKDYRCRYVARQIAVKVKYTLWVTQAEHDAMQRVLSACPGQQLPQIVP